MNRFLTGLFAVSLAVILMSTPVFATKIIVDGSQPTGGGHYMTLAEGFAVVGSNDWVEILPSTYSDHSLTVPSVVDSIIGGSGVIFDGVNNANHFLNLGAGGVVIRGLEVNNYDYGLHGSDVVGSEIDNMTFAGNLRAVRLDGASSGNDIHDCSMSGNDYGVILTGAATGNTVQFCTIIDGANFGVFISAATVGNSVTDNCFYGHPGEEGSDANASDVNIWRRNFFDDLLDHLVGGDYQLAGGAGGEDRTPATYTNTANSASTDWEFEESYWVTFDWDVANCNPQDKGLAAYEFTAHWNPAVLELVSESQAYDGLMDDPENNQLEAPITVGAGELTFAATNFFAPAMGNGIMGKAQFKVIDPAGATTIWLSSTYLDDGTVDLPVTDIDLVVITADTQDPEVSFTASGDGTYSAGGPSISPVELMITGSASDNHALASVKWKVLGYGGWTTVTNPMVDEVLDYTSKGVGEGGPYDLQVRAIDASGNIAIAATTFMVDHTGPSMTSITLADKDMAACANIGSEFTNEAEVAMVVVAADAGDTPQVQLSADGSGVWDAAIDLGSGDFTYTSGTGGLFADPIYGVHVRGIDAYGNPGGYISDDIKLKTDAPEPAGFTSSTYWTSNPVVELFVTTPGGGNLAVAYIVSEDDDGDAAADCNDARWITGALSSFPYTLLGGEGDIELFYSTRDAAGNVSAVPLSLIINYDVTGVEFLTHEVVDQDGDDCVGIGDSRMVDVNFTWDDATYPDAKKIGISETDGSGYAWTNITAMDPTGATVAYQLSNVEGDHEVFMVLRDGINNNGTQVSGSIELDRVTPAMTGVVPHDAAYDAAALDTDMAFTIHAVWSSSTDISLHIAGLSADAVLLKVSSDNFVLDSTVFAVGEPFDDPHTFVYPYTGATSPAPTCGPNAIYTKMEDCAGNQSAVITSNIYIDEAAPTMVEFSGPAKTASLTIAVVNDFEDDCATYSPWKYRIMETGVAGLVSWLGYNDAPSFILDDKGAGNDGVRTLTVEVADRAGNVATATFDVEVDMDAPGLAAGAVLQAMAPSVASAGYTGSATLNEILGIASSSADATQYRLRNKSGVGGSSLGWTDLATTSQDNWSLATTPVHGTEYTVQIKLRDDVLNASPVWLDLASITLLSDTPAHPPSAEGVPGNSLDIEFETVAIAHSYQISYHLTNEYPQYMTGDPAHPADENDGILMEIVSASAGASQSYSFPGPNDLQPDIFAVSIFTIDSAGNYSAPNTDVFETNYLLGDAPDGAGHWNDTISFVDEFLGGLLPSYNKTEGVDPEFNPVFDINTDDGSGTGIPRPNDVVDFEDMLIFAQNYQYYCDWCRAKSSGERGLDALGGGSPIAISIEVPEVLSAGQEFVVSIQADKVDDILGFKFVLDYDRDNLELVKVEAGNMFEASAQTFFHHEKSAEKIQFSGMVFGPNATFEGTEVAQVTLRAKNESAIDLQEVNVMLRDRENQDLEFSFNTAVTKVEPILPAVFGLSQNYPNPFNPSTIIEMSLPVASDYSLKVYNITGQLVDEFTGYSEAGTVTITWNAERRSSGVYLYRMEAGIFSETRKMILLK